MECPMCHKNIPESFIASEIAKKGKGVPKPKSAENGKKGGRPPKVAKNG